MTIDNPDDPDLRTDCQAIAYRAGQIHDWLGEVLRTSAAAERAYAFKARKKTADDIRNKVWARRKHEDPEQRDSNYTPVDVTDASGFRIVKLFNAEVPEALEQLLQLLKTPIPAGNLKGALRDGGVREIEFHTSRRLDDPLSIYQAVKDVVERNGFELKTSADVSEVRRSSKSSYSSVHVLLECEVLEASGDPICSYSEIQLRSVFEEAWSEISHRLKYAPAKVARASGAVPVEKNEPLSDAFLHLDALKSLTDGCAQYADLINRQAPEPCHGARRAGAQAVGSCRKVFSNVRQLRRRVARSRRASLSVAD